MKRRFALVAVACLGWAVALAMWLFWEPEDTYARGYREGLADCDDETQRAGA